ncbi:MAG: nucleotidyltransferase domain-containing protein [Candidatus Muiribacteriota bacterium]
MNNHVQNWLQTVKNIVLNNIDLDNFNVFLFGSYARGDFEQGSDFDIGIYGQEKIDLNIINKIKSEIDSCIVPNKIDIVDFTRITDLNFKKQALKDIIIWNRAKNFHLN